MKKILMLSCFIAAMINSALASNNNPSHFCSNLVFTEGQCLHLIKQASYLDIRAFKICTDQTDSSLTCIKNITDKVYTLKSIDYCNRNYTFGIGIAKCLKDGTPIARLSQDQLNELRSRPYAWFNDIQID